MSNGLLVVQEGGLFPIPNPLRAQYLARGVQGLVLSWEALFIGLESRGPVYSSASKRVFMRSRTASVRLSDPRLL